MTGTDILRDLWERPEEPRILDEWGRPLINIKRDIVKWIRRFENDCWLVEVQTGMYEVVRPGSSEWCDRPVCRKCRQ